MLLSAPMKSVDTALGDIREVTKLRRPKERAAYRKAINKTAVKQQAPEVLALKVLKGGAHFPSAQHGIMVEMAESKNVPTHSVKGFHRKTLAEEQQKISNPLKKGISRPRPARSFGFDRDALQGRKDVIKTKFRELVLTDHSPFLKLRVGDQRDQTDVMWRHVEKVEVTDCVNNTKHSSGAIGAMFAANVNQDVSVPLRSAERESQIPGLGVTKKAMPEHAFA